MIACKNVPEPLSDKTISGILVTGVIRYLFYSTKTGKLVVFPTCISFYVSFCKSSLHQNENYQFLFHAFR